MVSLFIFAFTTRLISLFFAGGFDSVLGYDDGVYYSATTAFDHGLIPYRDFVLVHPPGILYLLTPFTWIGSLTTDAFGFYLARVFFMLLGAISVVLIYRIGSRWNRTTALVAALFYAVWMPVVRIERTPYLEEIGILATLISIILILEGKYPRRALIISGMLLGLATSTKIWYAVSVVALTLWLAQEKRIKDALVLGATSVATFFSLTAFFIWKAGSRFFDLVLYAQIVRRATDITFASRIEQIFNLNSVNINKTKSISIALLIIIALAIFRFMWINRKNREGWLILLFFVLQLGVLLRTPVFFNAYPSFVAVSLAIIIGAVIGSYSQKSLTALAMIAIIPIGLHSSFTQEPGRDLPNKLERQDLSKVKCVTSDSPALLILTNTLSKNLENKCPALFDVAGDIYGIDGGSNPQHESSKYRQLHSPEYQREISRYLSSGGTVILARKQIDGLTTQTWQELLRGRKVTQSHSFYIISNK